jgi:RNA polymerase sigma-70 factor (ECF subfamily)
MEKDLIQQAKSGDAKAWDRLLRGARPALFAYLYRLTADRAQADDLSQETLLKAYGQISQWDERTSFKIWLFCLAFQLAKESVAGREPWGLSALDVLQDYLLEHKSAEQLLQEIYQDHEEFYQAQDHVNFCFTVMLRTLYIEEANAVILSQLSKLTPEQVGKVLQLPLEQVTRLIQDGTDSLSEALYDRCSLVRRGAPCTQCQDMGRWLNGEEKTQEQLEELPLTEGEKPQAGFATRIELLSSLDPGADPAKRFHGALLDILRRALGEKK